MRRLACIVAVVALVSVWVLSLAFATPNEHSNNNGFNFGDCISNIATEGFDSFTIDLIEFIYFLVFGIDVEINSMQELQEVLGVFEANVDVLPFEVVEIFDEILFVRCRDLPPPPE